MKTIAVVLVAVIMALGVSQAQAAEGPSKGFVAGIETGQIIGALGYYQINDMIQIGSGLGFQVGDFTQFYLSPQVRFLFTIVAGLQFVASGEFQLLFGDREGTGLAIKTALQHWLTSNIALYGGVSFLSMEFDPSVLGIGLLSPYVGAQFAFN